MQQEIAIVSILVGLILTIINIVDKAIQWSRQAKKEALKNNETNQQQDKAMAEFKVILNNIGSRIEETRISAKEISNYIADINTRLIIVERDVKTAHDRIDEMKKEIKSKKEVCRA